jgi:hypothetical protein
VRIRTVLSASQLLHFFRFLSAGPRAASLRISSRMALALPNGRVDICSITISAVRSTARSSLLLFFLFVAFIGHQPFQKSKPAPVKPTGAAPDLTFGPPALYIRPIQFPSKSKFREDGKPHAFQIRSNSGFRSLLGDTDRSVAIVSGSSRVSRSM